MKQFTCLTCGKLIYSYPSISPKNCSKECAKLYFSKLYKGRSAVWNKGKKLTVTHRSKIQRSLPKGAEHHNWTGGKYINSGGYVMITVYEDGKRKVIREHRLIMEKYLKRKLNRNEVVHHINGVRHDNRIENLILFPSHSDHMKTTFKPSWLK